MRDYAHIEVCETPENIGLHVDNVFRMFNMTKHTNVKEKITSKANKIGYIWKYYDRRKNFACHTLSHVVSTADLFQLFCFSLYARHGALALNC